MPSQKLWVAHATPAKTFGPTRVSIQGCEYVADFKDEIKKEFEITGPSAHLTLYQSDGKTEIKPTDTIKSLKDAGKDGDAPLIVRSTLTKGEVAVGPSEQPDTVNLHVYAPRATKKFEIINVTIKSGKINIRSLLKFKRWKALYLLEQKTLLLYDEDGWSFIEFISGNVYKVRYEIDDGYDDSIGFSDAKIDKVEKHFNLCIGSDYLAEEEYPLVDIPDSLFEQLVLLRKRNSLFSEYARRTLISLFLANAIEYADGEGKLLVDEEMSFSCVLEENGKRIKYNGPVDFAIGHSPVDARLKQDCALLVVEAKTVAKLGEALGQALAQAATNFFIRKQEGRGVNGHLKVYWCISDGESWIFGYITEGKGATLDVQQTNTTTCWFHQRHMIPKKEECSKLFSLIVFWVKEAMESSRTTSRRNSESVDDFDLDNLNIKFVAELQQVKKEIASTNQLLLAARIDSETNPQDPIACAKVKHYENQVARLDDYRKTLATALPKKRVEEKDRQVSRHKQNSATIDSQCILANIAAVFQEEYELDIKEGYSATFGDVLWALGNSSKNPKKYRAPAEPKEGYTVPIRERLSKRDWIYYRALNDYANPEEYPRPIPEVDGKKKLILPADDSLYNPHRIEATFRMLGIIEQEDMITFQKESEQT